MEEEVKIVVSLKSQTSWLLFAKIVGFGFAFSLPLLIVRFLSQETVGVYRQVFQIIINAVAILPLGINMSAYYFLARNKENRGRSILNILVFNFAAGGFISVLLYFFPQLAGGLFHSDEITRLAPVIGIVVWLWIFSSLLETVAVANQEPRMAATFIVAAQFTKMVFMAVAVFFFATVESFLIAAAVQGVLQTIVLFIYLRSRFPRFWSGFSFAYFRTQLIYALPFGFSGVLWILQTDIHNYFVGYRFSASEYAIYAYGCFELPLIGMIAESVSSVLIPQMTKLQAAGDKAEILRITARGMQKLAFFFFPIYAFLIITAPTFIVTLFTDKYLESVPIFIINLTLLPFYAWLNDPILRAYKELGKFLLRVRILTFTLLIGALFFGIRHFDLRGMIAIVVATVIIEKIILTIAVVRTIGVKRSDLHLLAGVAKTAGCTLLASLFTFLFYWQIGDEIFVLGAGFSRSTFSLSQPAIVDSVAGIFVLGSCLLVFLSIYLFSTNYFGVIEKSEREVFSGFFGRMFQSNS